MSKDKDFIARKILCGICAFLISLLLFFELSLVIVQNSVLSESYMRNQLSKSEYYNKVAQEIQEQWVSFGNASGFEEAFFETIINLDQLTFDINVVAKKLYSPDDKTEVDQVKLKDDLQEQFVKYAQEQSVEITPALQEGLDYLADTCVETYMSYVKIPYWRQLSHYLSLLQKPIKIMIVVLPILILILAAMIFLANRWRHRALRYYIYALSGCVLMLAGVPLISYSSGKIHKVAITFTSLYDFAVSYFYGILSYFWISAALFAIITAVFALVYHKQKQRMLKR